MLNLRKCLCTASPLKNCIYYSTKARKGRSQPARDRKSFIRQRTFGPNPGIDAQLSALQLDKKELNDPDMLENLESQFWDADKMHDKFEREKFIHQEHVGLYKIMRKQFKEEKTPNMLLYDDKLEIKALHSEDPEKWTIMKLAFSYPASPVIIKKILRANWKLKSQAEIYRHDRRVQRNWEALAKDQLYIPSKELKNHLLSFSNRHKAVSTPGAEVIRAEEIQVDENSTANILKGGGAFANIYESYKKLYESKPGTANHQGSCEKEKVDMIDDGLGKLYHPPENDTFIIPNSVQNLKWRTKQPLTMKEMQKRILHDAKRGEQLESDTLAFVQSQSEELEKQKSFEVLRDPIGKSPEIAREGQNVSSLQDHHGTFEEGDILEDSLHDSVGSSLSETNMDNEPINANKFVDLVRFTQLQKKELQEQRREFRTAHLERTAEETDAIVKGVKSYMANSSESYPLSIKIPNEVWRKGALYRIKDRFYTDDGEFLYRVPGLRKE